MAFHRPLAHLAHDDEALYDMSKGMPEDWTPPEYPYHLVFSLSKEDLTAIGAEGGDPGDTMRFSAMAEVTSVYRGRDDSRIELSVALLAGEDGKFHELAQPGHICLCGPELEKMDLGDDAELGDLLHVFGELRLESLMSTEYGDAVTLQITHLAFENESDEEPPED